MPFVTQREGQLTEIYITLSRLITACCDSSEDQKTNENNLIKNIQKILKLVIHIYVRIKKAIVSV